MPTPAAPLLTRGMGPSPALVTSGFLGTISEVVRKVIRRARAGGRSIVNKLPDIYKVKAMLLSVNRSEILDPRSKLLITEVHDKENSKVTISDISTTSVKSTPYRIVISDVKVKKGG